MICLRKLSRMMRLSACPSSRFWLGILSVIFFSFRVSLAWGETAAVLKTSKKPLRTGDFVPKPGADIRILHNAPIILATLNEQLIHIDVIHAPSSNGFAVQVIPNDHFVVPRQDMHQNISPGTTQTRFSLTIKPQSYGKFYLMLLARDVSRAAQSRSLGVIIHVGEPNQGEVAGLKHPAPSIPANKSTIPHNLDEQTLPMPSVVSFPAQESVY